MKKKSPKKIDVFQQKIRSRSFYKIEEMDKKYSLIESNFRVIDLGSSPGGWSQYISKKIRNGKIFCCDILPMDPIEKTDFILGDILKYETKNKLFQKIKNQKVNAIFSDMCPNISGFSEIDIPNFFSLIRNILDICEKFLLKDGNLLFKFFYGKDMIKNLKKISSFFRFIKIEKPNYSKKSSKESYIIAKGYKKK
ncbi:SAM-dependent methyltransferase [bacterium endosymbiont of Pedicinus badii]|uniref:SAM-dependent methyltransferase n=1 Tax=bacterium endosymbiont of Pedicinus badii TaxID=1719126 RepID=UPI0009BB4D11|nr:RlmE family RNA methyltransferase [bacterium endosymbiont of Pedicinus badii]OQM34188.1 hypothetical protein AOQ89_02525 [bacterium endosymbiont of Pedicinus badii]